MKCKGDFVFKSLVERVEGSFINDKGVKVNYPASYVLQVDENTGDNIYERKFKFSKDNTTLATKLLECHPYTLISITFDVGIYNNRVSIVPVDIEVK